MQVRRARPADAAAIAEAHVRSWQQAYEHVFGAEKLEALNTEARTRLAEQAIAEADVAVAEDDEGGVVGFAYVRESRDVEGEGELWAIYCVAEAWGTGAGTALMDWAKEALRRRRDVATLWVLEDNPRARRFYEREGWTLDGEAKTDRFLGVDVGEVRYRLRLR
ncbi:MAG: GNAT family N-acetyltransferase [Actinomycetota bacterium]